MTDKFTEEQRSHILLVIEQNLTTLGCVEFMLKIRPFKMWYLKWSSVFMLTAIIIWSLPYYFFFFPLLPIIAVNIVYFIDLNVLVYGLNKAHTQLIQDKILIDWDEVMGFAFDYFTNSINTQK